MLKRLRDSAGKTIYKTIYGWAYAANVLAPIYAYGNVVWTLIDAMGDAVRKRLEKYRNPEIDKIVEERGESLRREIEENGPYK